MKVMFQHKGNEGYGADQVQGMTLADLLATVQDAIEEYGDDAEVVLYQTNNGRGACYGTLHEYETVIGEDDER